MFQLKIKIVRKSTERIRGIFGIYLKLIKETPKDHRLLDLEALGFDQILPKNLPGHWTHFVNSATIHQP